MDFRPETDIPDLTGKVILVTGGTDGLGKETITQLCQHSPSHIYMTGRNKTKATKVLSDLSQSHPHHAPITFLEFDMSSLQSIQSGAREFLSLSTRLDVLICNAGLGGQPALTKDGYELAFGTNHLGHALLIQLLLPTLRATATEPTSDVRVVCVSSLAESLAPKNYTFDSMRTPLSNLGLMTRYGQSKLANIHYATLLAQKYPEITFVSLHPGAVKTNFGGAFFAGNAVFEFVLWVVCKPFVRVVEVDEGAWGQLWAATAARGEVVSGEFYWPVGRAGKGSRRSRDLDMARGLWEYTEVQIGEYL